MVNLVVILCRICEVAARVPKLVLGAFGTAERGGHRRSVIVAFKRVMLVSYRLSIVTIMLSLTIRSEFTIKYLRCSNQRVSQFMAKFGEEKVERCKPHFHTGDMVLSYSKEIVSISSVI